MAFTVHHIAFLATSIPGEAEHAGTVADLNAELCIDRDDDAFKNTDTLLIAGDGECGAVLWGTADEVAAHLRRLADEIEDVSK